MKAKNYLSKKTPSILKELDLSAQAEELQNLLKNIESDLPCWILRLDSIECHSSILSAVRSLGFNLNTSGGLFRSAVDNKILRKSYEGFINANSFDLSRELACATFGLKVSSLKVNKNDAFAISITARKLIHKAWVHSKWNGEVYESLSDMFNSVSFPFKEKKTIAVQAFQREGCYCQRNNGLWYEPKVVPMNRLLRQPKILINESLNIVSVGIGELKTKEEIVPVFNHRKAKERLYIVGQNKSGAIHLLEFEDFNVLGLVKKMKITEWRLSRLCNSSSAFLYVLQGFNSSDKENAAIELYGHAPFYTPSIVRE